MERRRFLQYLGGALIAAKGGELIKPQIVQAEENELDHYLAQIEPERQQYAQVVAVNELFKGFQNSCNDRRKEDFEMYFPIYKACELSYGIPWSLLWAMHVQETMVSTHPNPGETGYVGAMQRYEYFWKDRELAVATEGWSFLSTLPQRYNKPRTVRNPNSFSVDYQEILWSAHHIRMYSDLRYPHLPPIERFLQFVRYNYSAEKYGIQRVNKYLEIAGLFTFIPPEEKSLDFGHKLAQAAY